MDRLDRVSAETWDGADGAAGAASSFCRPEGPDLCCARPGVVDVGGAPAGDRHGAGHAGLPRAMAAAAGDRHRAVHALRPRAQRSVARERPHVSVSRRDDGGVARRRPLPAG